MAKLELNTDTVYDILIAGGGPAAMNAALYAQRKGLKTGIICKDFGGHVKDTVNIENYLGFKRIDGYDLIERFKDQIIQYDCYVKEFSKAVGIRDGKIKTIITDDGSEYRSKTLILATGSVHRRLNIPGENELFGVGVSYCAICDGPLFRNRDVVIAGGGNSAVSAAIDLSKICREIIIVHRSAFRADSILRDRLNECPNIEVNLEHTVIEVFGDGQVEGIRAFDNKLSVEKTIKTDALFIEIGLIPNSGYAKGVVDINESGEIIIDSRCMSSRPGIFAAGDVTTSPFKQIVTASAEGAIAALSANEYINRTKI